MIFLSYRRHLAGIYLSTGTSGTSKAAIFHYGFDRDEDWNEILSFVQSYGGVEYSFRRAKEFGRQAKASLEPIAPSLERDALCYAADYVTERVDPLSA